VVTRDGAQIFSWGNYTSHTRWASVSMHGHACPRPPPLGSLRARVDVSQASKPIFASLMLAAIADGKLASVDTPLRELGWCDAHIYM
jgi:hypothetical protein